MDLSPCQSCPCTPLASTSLTQALLNLSSEARSQSGCRSQGWKETHSPRLPRVPALRQGLSQMLKLDMCRLHFPFWSRSLDGGGAWPEEFLLLVEVAVHNFSPRPALNQPRGEQ